MRGICSSREIFTATGRRNEELLDIRSPTRSLRRESDGFQNRRGMGGPPMFSLQKHGRAARATGYETSSKFLQAANPGFLFARSQRNVWASRISSLLRPFAVNLS
jgi:hypothetical protein